LIQVTAGTPIERHNSQFGPKEGLMLLNPSSGRAIGLFFAGTTAVLQGWSKSTKANRLAGCIRVFASALQAMQIGQ